MERHTLSFTIACFLCVMTMEEKRYTYFAYVLLFSLVKAYSRAIMTRTKLYMRERDWL